MSGFELDGFIGDVTDELRGKHAIERPQRRPLERLLSDAFSRASTSRQAFDRRDRHARGPMEVRRDG